MKDLLKLFNQDQAESFNSIKAGLASSQHIRSLGIDIDFEEVD